MRDFFGRGFKEGLVLENFAFTGRLPFCITALGSVSLDLFSSSAEFRIEKKVIGPRASGVVIELGLSFVLSSGRGVPTCWLHRP